MSPALESVNLSLIESSMNSKVMSNSDYHLLKIFLDIFFERYIPKHPTTPDLKPSQFLEEIEKKSLSNAKKGAEMTVNDSIELTADWSPEEVAGADALFSQAGTLTLTEVRQRYSRKYLQVLQRGKIRSEVEYYLIRGVVDGDGDGVEPEPEVCEKLQIMLDAYEFKSLKNRQ